MANKQAISLQKPQENEREITLTLYCVNCKASKSFIITEALKNMLIRNSQGIAYSSVCEICGKEIGVKINWTESLVIA